jgi:hypothetical protein
VDAIPNLSFADWPTIFPTAACTTALIDWRQRRVRLAFPDAVPSGGIHSRAKGHHETMSRMRWSTRPGSSLIAAIQIGSTEGYRHFKLCFNAASVLDVIARGIQLLPDG